MDVGGEVARNEEVTPIPLRQVNGQAKASKLAIAEPNGRKTEPLETSRSRLADQRKIPCALARQKLLRFRHVSRIEKQQRGAWSGG
jgi:hypothetical protein